MNKRAYKRYRKSKRWQAKRRTILKRAGYKGRKCGRRHATQVHYELERK